MADKFHKYQAAILAEKVKNTIIIKFVFLRVNIYYIIKIKIQGIFFAVLYISCRVFTIRHSVANQHVCFSASSDCAALPLGSNQSSRCHCALH